MSEINEGVRILVERMKINPEEFYDTGYRSRWGVVLERAANAKWLTEEEHKLLNDAADEMQRDRFTADVLRTLTKGEEDPYISEAQAKQMYLNPAQMKAAKALGGFPTVTYTGNGAANTIANTLTVGGSPVATQSDIERVLAEKLKAWENEK